MTFFEKIFRNLVGMGWGRGGGEVVMVTKKRKSLKVIDFKNFNILNLKANILPSLFSQKNVFFLILFSQNLIGGRVGER